LFANTLESEHTIDGIATPFDSGGLLKVFASPDPSIPPREFLSAYELPIPGHRDYLKLSLDVLFTKPVDYVDGTAPHHSGPIGLTRGDLSRWTHEVRIPQRVAVQTRHLQAVFAPESVVSRYPEVESLFAWCATQGVDTIPFAAPHGGEFEIMRDKCRDYTLSKLQ
jgi:hypothetical protein